MKRDLGRVLKSGKHNPQKCVLGVAAKPQFETRTFGDTVNENSCKSMVQQLPKPNVSQDSEKPRKSGRIVCTNEREKKLEM